MSDQIRYAFNREDGLVISRLGDFVAWPVLDYEKIGKDGDFRGPMEYNLEVFPVSRIGAGEWRLLVWTRYLPTPMKNAHREFWGLKPLKVEPYPQTLEELCAAHRTRFYLEHPDGEIGVVHSLWGSRVKLYHWFTRTEEGFVPCGVTDNVDGTYKAAVRKAVRERS